MSFYRNIISNAGATVIGSAAQLLLIVVLARLLSVNDFAIFITTTAVIGFGEMASDFGVRIWATRQFAIRKSLIPTLHTAFITKVGFSLLLIAIITVIPITLLSAEQTLLATLIACTQPSTDPLLWLLRGKERLDVEALVTLLWRLGNAVIIVILALYSNGVTLLLFAWLCSNLFRFFVEAFLPTVNELIRKEDASKGGYNTVQTLAVVRQSLPIGAAFIAMAVYHRMGVFILGALTSAETVAHYGAALTLVSSAGFIATSITVSSFPLLAKAVESNNWPLASDIINKKLWLVKVVFIPVCFLGMFIAPIVVNLLYPPSYAPAAMVMVVLLSGLYISSINFALKYLMNVLHHNVLDLLSVISGICIYVIVLFSFEENLLLVAAFAWGLGELTIFFARCYVLGRSTVLKNLYLRQHFFIYIVLLFISAYIWWQHG